MEQSRIKAKFVTPGDILVRGAFGNWKRYEVMSVRKAADSLCFKVQLVSDVVGAVKRGPIDFWTKHADSTISVENS
jgi:hypothetical protein